MISANYSKISNEFCRLFSDHEILFTDIGTINRLGSCTACCPTLGSDQNSTMSGATSPTPSVSVKLDDSEIMRLEKLRSRLKLSHWARIGKKYVLKADDGVAKTIRDMKTNNTVEHDNKYANWTNRYSDFNMEWKKLRNATTGEIEGHLVATGRPRLDNLGRIGDGCQIDLMHGPILDEPLPTTKVGDL